MRIAIFCHSLLSDWNHGNAHFLRGLATDLTLRGHDVRVYEPKDAWSYANLLVDKGPGPVAELRKAYPLLNIKPYLPDSLDLEAELDETDLLWVHEWNAPALVAALGKYRLAHRRCRLLFHDTHHRSVTDPQAMARYDLSAFDGVLAFGDVIRKIYLHNRWAKRVWVLHEAADIRVFHPLARKRKTRDLVWIGNWGDEERTAELKEFLLEPVRRLKLSADVFGVRYPDKAVRSLRRAGVHYGGWLANFDVPKEFARHRVTVHVPRRPYVQSLPGIPTIRPFEALACGIPLVTAPWEDREGLFTPGRDYLVARNGKEMKAHLRAILHHPRLAKSLSEHGRQTILSRHTCSHRANQLLEICQELSLNVRTHAAEESAGNRAAAPPPAGSAATEGA